MRAQEALNSRVGAAIAGGLAGMAVLEGATGAGLHRGDTSHRSIDLPPAGDWFVDVVLGAYTDRSGWGATHIEGHHKLADVNLLPFVEIADHMKWREANPGARRDHPEPPEEFDNLDPFARRISLERAVEIGEKARDLVDGRYDPQAIYSAKGAQRALDATSPRYVYKDIKAKAKRPKPGQWPDDQPVSLDDVSHRLMDPHSPSLHPEGITFRAFSRDMLDLYAATERMWDSNEELPEYAQRSARQQWVYKRRSKLVALYVAAQVAGAVGIGAALGQTKPREVVKNALAGGTAAAISGKGLVLGGVLTNFFGHLGKYPMHSIRTGRATPHEDGSLATNGSRLFGFPTMDEAGWQGNHHDHPDWTAFAERFDQAPFGNTLKFLAERGIFGLGLGDGFGTDHRPDELHEAAQMVQQERVRTLEDLN